MEKICIHFDSDSNCIGTSKLYSEADWAAFDPGPNAVITTLETPVDPQTIHNEWKLVNGQIYKAGPKPSKWHDWSKAASSYVLNMTRAKQEQWDAIKEKRTEIENAGFYWQTYLFDSDPISQSRIQGAVQMAQIALSQNQPFSIDWTIANDTVVTLSAQDMVSVGLALGSHINQCHVIGRQLREQIDAAQTPEVLESVVWPSA